jgi:hypothetical protein
VIHGRVVDAEGKALRDVRVSVKNHPDFGFSMSRKDGCYDLVVNGGGIIVLDYERQGYLGAERSVGLVRVSPELHTVKVGSAQVVRAEQTDDKFGERQPFVVFPQGITAEAVLANGKREKLSEFHLRVTEYPFETQSDPMPGAAARFAPKPIRRAQDLLRPTARMMFSNGSCFRTEWAPGRTDLPCSLATHQPPRRPTSGPCAAPKVYLT